MELSIKDWMIIATGLLLAAVLFDGLRRVINDRRSNIRMRAKPVYDDDRSDIDLTSHEIPGNARIVLRADGTPMPRNEQQHVPVLLEPADDLKAKKSRRKKKEKNEPVVDDLFELTNQDSSQSVTDSAAVKSSASAATSINPASRTLSPYRDEDEDDGQEDDAAADIALNEVLNQQQASTYSASSETQSASSVSQSATQSTPEKHSAVVQEQDVVVLHVLSKDDAGFKGTDLMQILLGCDMRYGRMNIFHRYEEGSTEEIQFSVANLVEPGTFDLDALHHFNTPGVTFFMTLPGPEYPLQSFDYMAATAQEVARHMNGAIYDERKRPVDENLIAERRQSIQRYASQTATA